MKPIPVKPTPAPAQTTITTRSPWIAETARRVYGGTVKIRLLPAFRI